MSETPLKITPEQQRQFDETASSSSKTPYRPTASPVRCNGSDELYDRYRRVTRSRSSPSLSDAQYRHRSPL